MAVLDTTVFVDLRGRGGAARRRSAEEIIRALLMQDDILMTTRINVAELYTGAFRSDDAGLEMQRVEEMLHGIVILELDDSAARQFGRIKSTLSRRGQPIGDADIFIASITLTHGERLVTRNVDHYQRISDLPIQSY